MVDIVNQDHGRGGTGDANNREYGGVIKTDGTVAQSPAGPVAKSTHQRPVLPLPTEKVPRL